MILIKRKTAFIIFSCILTFLVHIGGVIAQPSTIEAANEAYNARNYTNAISLYQQIIDEESESAEIYFNIGNCHYSMNNIGSSILYYEKAKRLKNNSGKIKEALAIASKRVESRITEIPDFFLVRWNDSLANALSSSVWVALQITFGLLFIGFIYLILFKEQNTRPYIMGACLLFALIILSVHFGYRKSILENGGDRAVVMEDLVNLYESADERSGIVTDVSEGVTVRILTQIGDWYKVILADKDVGWIEIKKVAII